MKLLTERQLDEGDYCANDIAKIQALCRERSIALDVAEKQVKELQERLVEKMHSAFEAQAKATKRINELEAENKELKWMRQQLEK